MPSDRRVRLPISTRHAFALAFDLAVRRDAWNSIVVPLLLRAPWVLALAVMPMPSESDRPGLAVLLYVAALIGDFVVSVVIGAMLRFRARSVFNTPDEVHPAPASDCYARGLRRVPWLVVTEIARNVALGLATLFLVVPGVWLGFRLSFATEAVVLHEPHTEAAFQRSFRVTPKHLERWLEMIALSVILALSVVFLTLVLSLVFPQTRVTFWVAATYLLIAGLMPVIQYAWTFFYLRLVEIDTPLPSPDPGPLYAADATHVPHA